jgi:CBS domain-containing protein
MAQVRELMTPQPVKVPATQPIQDCARILWRLGLRHLPVVDDKGRCVGVISDFDLLQHGEIVSDDGAWLARTGDDPRAIGLARTDPVECRETDELDRVIAEMRDRATDVAVVVDPRRHPIGILTEHDVVRWARLTLPDVAILPTGQSAVHAVDLHASAMDAFDAMIDHDVRHLVVLDDGLPVGVLSWRDLVVEDVVSFRNVRVSDVLRTAHATTLPVGASWPDVANLMVRERIGCVPLVAPDGHVAMVLTRTDVLGQALGKEPPIDELLG